MMSNHSDMETNENKRKCDEALDQLAQLFENETCGKEDLKRVVDQYPGCKEELVTTYSLWMELDELPVPEISDKAVTNFSSTMEQIRADENNQHLNNISGYFSLNQVMKWAAIFILGLGLGLIINHNKTQTVAVTNSVGAVESNQTGLEATNTTVVRLAAIHSLKENTDPSLEIYEMLYTTLTNDTNDNVRLSALEALQNFSDKTRVREMLIKAIMFQDSPMVQLSLLEALLSEQNDTALQAVKEMLKEGLIDMEVKIEVEETINNI